MSTRLFARVVTLVALTLLVAAAAGAQEAARAGQDDLLRRLEQAESRIAALEELAQRQSEQLATLLASATRTTAAAPATPPAQETKASNPAQAPPERPVTHQLEAVKLNGLAQGWYAAGNQDFTNTFRIRRAELYLTGDVTKKARWQVMVDPAKALGLELASTPVNGSPVLTAAAISQAGRILQNAFITFDFPAKLQASVGQYKLPLTYEGLQSSGRLDTVERALFASDRARGGNYGDVRDIGLTVRGSVGRRMEFTVGAFNGIAESQNEVDRNDQKAAAGRLVARPVDGLHVGASGAWDPGGAGRPRRERWGGEVQYARGAWLLRSEVTGGLDGPLHRRGFYGHVGYRFVPRVEGILRVDGWDPDTASESTRASVSELDYVLGLNVFLSQHNLKLQVNYLRKTFDTAIQPSRNVLLVNTQTFW